MGRTVEDCGVFHQGELDFLFMQSVRCAYVELGLASCWMLILTLERPELRGGSDDEGLVMSARLTPNDKSFSCRLNMVSKLKGPAHCSVHASTSRGAQ